MCEVLALFGEKRLVFGFSGKFIFQFIYIDELCYQIAVSLERYTPKPKITNQGCELELEELGNFGRTRTRKIKISELELELELEKSL